MITKENTKIAAIIPARMGSSRFPGKPLLKVHDLPMIEHVRRRALLCNEFSDVVVATCDKEIADVVESYNGKVIMTSDKHIMASDRVADAIDQVECTHVVNVQGDEILILPEDLEKMIDSIKSNPDNLAWNATAYIKTEEELTDLSIVKCVVSQSERIMYCSRDFSNLIKSKNFEPVRIILGILGYSRDFIKKYSSLGRAPIEINESIDQSRIIENDFEIKSVLFSKGYPGINEPREVNIVENILNNDLKQKQILEQILK